VLESTIARRDLIRIRPIWHHSCPAQPLSTTSTGFGTAPSPPLWWMLAQAFFVLRAARTGGASRAAVGALMVFGATECVGALGEPVTLEAFAPSTFDPLLALTQIGMILLPLGAAVCAFAAWRSPLPPAA
jgi:hypothetical protein